VVRFLVASVLRASSQVVYEHVNPQGHLGRYVPHGMAHSVTNLAGNLRYWARPTHVAFVRCLGDILACGVSGGHGAIRFAEDDVDLKDNSLWRGTMHDDAGHPLAGAVCCHRRGESGAEVHYPSHLSGSLLGGAGQRDVAHAPYLAPLSTVQLRGWFGRDT
jgi:hypothetical protein